MFALSLLTSPLSFLLFWPYIVIWAGSSIYSWCNVVIFGLVYVSWRCIFPILVRVFISCPNVFHMCDSEGIHLLLLNDGDIHGKAKLKSWSYLSSMHVCMSTKLLPCDSLLLLIYLIARNTYCNFFLIAHNTYCNFFLGPKGPNQWVPNIIHLSG